MKKLSILLLSIITLLSCEPTANVTVKVDSSKPRIQMSKDLIGVFFEDINYGADGGLYAELVQNRSFEYYKVPNYVDLEPLHAWELVEKEGASAKMAIKNAKPLNKNNTKYLQLSISKGEAGIKNTGFDGITINGGETYKFSVYMRRSSNFNEPVSVKILNMKDNEIGSGSIEKVGKSWKKYAFDIKATASCKMASLVLTTKGSGEVYFDMVSLFPEKTFKNRENGLRLDLAQAVADLQPKFLRFPGGCISHGKGLDNAYRWKHTVGDVAERKPNFNTWGYHQTYGLGFFEYFQYAEDMGAIPLPVVPIGISCQFRGREVCPIPDMQMWVDDALDLIEFANGAPETEWGKVRAKMGHPKPFNMEYICLGNEEDNIPEFRERFMMIHDAISEKYPEIKIIGTSGVDDTGWHYETLWEFSIEHKLDAVDEHYYNDPNWFLNNVNRYDNFDRKGPKVFMGEYASRNDLMYNAIAEAAYLTGVEKNADIIEFACYAPLFSNVHHQQWQPDLIRFDNTSVSKTASYYVQQIYSIYGGDEYIPSTVKYDETFELPANDYTGQFGVGTWGTQAKYTDLKIEANGQTIIENVFENLENWKTKSGEFSIENGEMVQSSLAEPSISFFEKPVNVSEYTISVKAMKTGGREGFLIPFANHDGSYFWLNVAGWGNSQHAIQQIAPGGSSVLKSCRGHIENNQWYTIKIVVNKESAKCYIDDEMIFEIPGPPTPVTASIVENTENNEVIVKLVNSSESEITSNVNLAGIKVEKQAKLITFAGDPSARNSIQNPELLKPVESEISVSEQFNCLLPPTSIKTIILKKK